MRKLCMKGYSIKNGMQHKKGTDNSTRTHIRVAPFLSTISCATADTTNPAAVAAATHLTVAWLQELDQQQQQ